MHRLRFVPLIVLLATAACSSTSGGSDGSAPANTRVIVVPQERTVVCPDGAPPPCR